MIENLNRIISSHTDFPDINLSDDLVKKIALGILIVDAALFLVAPISITATVIVLEVCALGLYASFKQTIVEDENMGAPARTPILRADTGIVENESMGAPARTPILRADTDSEEELVELRANDIFFPGDENSYDSTEAMPIFLREDSNLEAALEASAALARREEIEREAAERREGAIELIKEPMIVTLNNINSAMERFDTLSIRDKQETAARVARIIAMLEGTLPEIERQIRSDYGDCNELEGFIDWFHSTFDPIKERIALFLID